MGKRHPEVGVPVGIDRELRDIQFLVPQYALNGRTHLAFMEYKGCA